MPKPLETSENSHIVSQKKPKQSKKDLTDKWLQMTTPEVTEEIRNDFRYLELRRFSSKKNFYKSSGIKGVPDQFQVGTVIEGAGDFYSGRFTKKQRPQSIVEEVYASRQQSDKYVPKSAQPPKKSRYHRTHTGGKKS